MASAVAWDAAGNLYVADPGNHRIQKFGPDRQFLTAWGSEGLPDGQPLVVEDLAVDARGRLYATDFVRSSQVLVFDGDGQLLRSWGVYGVDEGQLMNTGGIAMTRRVTSGSPTTAATAPRSSRPRGHS